MIHGSTGAQGAPVVSVLAAAGTPVVALTRNADAVVDGATVVTVNSSSAAELTDVYRGADGVFVHLPLDSEENRRAYARNIVTAVREARPARGSSPPAAPSSRPASKPSSGTPSKRACAPTATSSSPGSR